MFHNLIIIRHIVILLSFHTTPGPIIHAGVPGTIGTGANKVCGHQWLGGGGLNIIVCLRLCTF